VRRQPVDLHPEHALARDDLIARAESRDLHPALVDVRPVRALEVAKLATRRVDLDQEWSRESAVSSGIGQWTNRDRPTMNVSWLSKTNVRPLRGP
jgi:hypothetical protein